MMANKPLALVTGGASGVGLATVDPLARDGFRLALHERPFLEVSRADFRRAYEINLIAVATLTQASVPRMPGGGRIVNIASRAYLGARNHPHYVASKAALVGYTRASALELAPRGILVNAIAPGLIATPMLRALSPARLRAQLALQPTGQAGRPEDIAQAVSFLVAPQTGFI